MSDLISRSALYDALIKCDGLGRKSCEAVVKVIKNQPTAYNVDAVVKELEEIRKAFAEGKQLYGYCIKHGDCGDTNCFDCVLTNAIELVRKGGVEPAAPDPEPKPEPNWKQALLRTFLGRN